MADADLQPLPARALAAVEQHPPLAARALAAAQPRAAAGLAADRGSRREREAIEAAVSAARSDGVGGGKRAAGLKQVHAWGAAGFVE